MNLSLSELCVDSCIIEDDDGRSDLTSGRPMGHRKFQRRLDELVAELTYPQAQKVVAALQQRIEGWVRERNGLKRRRCLDCRCTFNALTGTPLARLRKKERWLGFTEALNGSLPVRKAAGTCKVNKNTALKWHHRFLKVQNQSKDQSLTGTAEVDKIFLLESFKGQRKLPRTPRKRGGTAEKPGLSAEQIPILIVRDRSGAHLDAVLPPRSEATVPPVLQGKMSQKRTLACTDDDNAVIAFLTAECIEYELIIASKGEHLHEKVLHIQTANANAGRLKQWLGRFNGVATTKYLQSYLGWRRWLEKGEDAVTPKNLLVAALCLNLRTIQTEP